MDRRDFNKFLSLFAGGLCVAPKDALGINKVIQNIQYVKNIHTVSITTTFPIECTFTYGELSVYDPPSGDVIIDINSITDDNNFYIDCSLSSDDSSTFIEYEKEFNPQKYKQFFAINGIMIKDQNNNFIYDLKNLITGHKYTLIIDIFDTTDKIMSITIKNCLLTRMNKVKIKNENY